MDRASGGIALKVAGISKSFDGTPVLRDVSLEVLAGEVHALAGHNGSGKSTLIKVLAGYHHPDAAASVTVDSETQPWHKAQGELRRRLRFVHQDPGLLPNLNAVENLALGNGYERRRIGLIDWRRESRQAASELAALGIDLDIHAPVDRLSPVERTMLAVARAMRSFRADNGVLVLDEPTAALTATEVSSLFRLIRTTTARGAGVLLVTHATEEIIEIADQVTVLRDGRVVDCLERSRIDRPSILAAITGAMPEFEHPGHDRHSPTGRACLSAVDLSPRLTDTCLSLEVRSGEIVGVAGITGSGREVVGRALAGAIPLSSGRVQVDGRNVDLRTPRTARRAGIAFLPADRAGHASFATMTATDNVTIGVLRRLTVLGRLDGKRSERLCSTWMSKLNVLPPRPWEPLKTFSGGNQQKLVLARSLASEPQVLVVEEPTQGVDVGAKAAIHAVLRDMAANGMAIVMSSSDLEELVDVADRIVVMNGGVVTADLSAEATTPGTLLHACLRDTSGRGPYPVAG